LNTGEKMSNKGSIYPVTDAGSTLLANTEKKTTKPIDARKMTAVLREVLDEPGILTIFE